MHSFFTMSDPQEDASQAALFCQNLKAKLGPAQWRQFQQNMRQLSSNITTLEDRNTTAQAFRNIIFIFDGRPSFLEGFKFFLDNSTQAEIFERELAAFYSTLAPKICKVQVNHMTIDIFFKTHAPMVKTHGVKIRVNEREIFDTPEHRWNEAGTRLTLLDNFTIYNDDNVVILNLNFLKNTNGLYMEVPEFNISKVHTTVKRKKQSPQDYVSLVKKTLGDVNFRKFQQLMAEIKPNEVVSNQACFLEIIDVFDADDYLIQEFKQFLDGEQELLFDQMSKDLASPLIHPRIKQATVSPKSITIKFQNNVPMNFEAAKIKLIINGHSIKFRIRKDDSVKKKMKNQTMILDGFKIFKGDQVFLTELDKLRDIRHKKLQRVQQGTNILELHSLHIDISRNFDQNNATDNEIQNNNNNNEHNNNSCNLNSQVNNNVGGSTTIAQMRYSDVNGVSVQSASTLNHSEATLATCKKFLNKVKDTLGPAQYKKFQRGMYPTTNRTDADNKARFKEIISLFFGHEELLIGFEVFLDSSQLIVYREICCEVNAFGDNADLAIHYVNTKNGTLSSMVEGEQNMRWIQVPPPTSEELEQIRRKKIAQMIADKAAPIGANYEYVALIKKTIGAANYTIFQENMRSLDLAHSDSLDDINRACPNDAIYNDIVKLFDGDLVLCNGFEKFMNHRKRDQEIFRQLRNKYNKNKLTKLYQEQLTKQHLQNQATTLNNDYYTSSTVVNEIRRQSRNVVSETNDENIGDDVSSNSITNEEEDNLLSNDVLRKDGNDPGYGTKSIPIQSLIQAIDRDANDPLYSFPSVPKPKVMDGGDTSDVEQEQLNVAMQLSDFNPKPATKNPKNGGTDKKNVDYVNINDSQNNYQINTDSVNLNGYATLAEKEEEERRVLEEARKSDIFVPQTTFCKCHHKKCFNCRNCKRHCTCVAGFSLRTDFTELQQKQIMFKSYVNRRASVLFEDKWYNATVIAFDHHDMKHTIKYDVDQQCEIIELEELQRLRHIRWLKGTIHSSIYNGIPIVGGSTRNISSQEEQDRLDGHVDANKKIQKEEEKAPREKKDNNHHLKNFKSNFVPLETNAKSMQSTREESIEKNETAPQKEDMYDMKNTDVKIKHALIFIYKVKQYIGFQKHQIFLDHINLYVNQIDLNVNKLVVFAEKNFVQPHQNTELLDGFLNFLPDDDANRVKTKWTRKGLLPKFPRSKVNGKPLATPENKNNILTGKKRSHSHDNESPHKNQELVKDNEITHDNESPHKNPELVKDNEINNFNRFGAVPNRKRRRKSKFPNLPGNSKPLSAWYFDPTVTQADYFEDNSLKSYWEQAPKINNRNGDMNENAIPSSTSSLFLRARRRKLEPFGKT